MPTLDNSVLIRYLVKDDPKQAGEAEQFILQYAGSQAMMFIPLSVVLETKWVLLSVYQFQKQSVIVLFVNLLQNKSQQPTDKSSLVVSAVHSGMCPNTDESRGYN